MASLASNYTELQFTKKSWEFVSSMENFPFDKLPQEGSGSRGTWTMRDVKACLPKPEKKNPHGIFASEPAKKLFENSKISEDSLKDKVPSGKNGGFTVKDIKKLLPKEEKKNSLEIFASKPAKELFEKSGLSKDLLENPSGKNGLYCKAEVEQALIKKAFKKEED